MNPFQYANIVEGDFFYDRKKELKRIVQTLEGGNNLVLYAPRRYGKSSLVRKALKVLENKNIKTVYLDFMSVYSRETFIKNYTKAIAENEDVSVDKTLKKIARFLKGIVPSVSFDSYGNPSFSIARIEGADEERTLLEVMDLPEKLASAQQKWVVAFDEFQEITTLNGESFEKQLRSVIQHHQNVSYLFLGSRAHLLKDMFNNKNRAFYNAAMLMNIDIIDQPESVDYLMTHFGNDGIETTRETANYIVEKAFGIPYYIQFIAAEIWQSVINDGKVVTKEIVDESLKQIILLKSDYYWELTGKQTNYRKKVLKALCDIQDTIFSQAISKKHNLRSASSTQKALESLLEQGVIEKINKNYLFTDPLYRLFIKQYL
ncbi:MAG: ATP-binding protein [Bacteroidales bacterium]|nr:ATP-binding protein [Bacteroidales bacterium]